MSFEDFSGSSLFDPDSPRADERRELLEHLLARGFTAEQILNASADTIPVYLAARLTSGARPRETLRSIASRCDIDLDQLVRLRQACGFAVGDPDVADVHPSFDEVVTAFKFGCEAFGEEATLAFARVLGVSVARIVEAARAMFSSTMRDSSATELQVSQNNEAANAGWATTHASIGALIRERLSRDSDFTDSLLHGELLVGVGFVDLVDSTPWSAARTTDDQAAALAIFARDAHQLAASHGARLVKLIGDEAMIVAADPAATCRVAAELCAAVDREPRLPRARAAVGFGVVTARDGDYFGPVVNLVARATKTGAPGAVVVTADVAGRLHPDRWTVTHLGAHTLRGIDGPIDLWEAVPR